MREKIVFVITNNSKFFFRLNKELKKLGIPFTVLNLGQHIPNVDSIVLTTLKEVFKINNYNNKKVNFIPYKDEENFDKYFFNFLKIYHCGFGNHSKLLLSIDPGKTIGLIVFLDGHFFYSKTFYNKKELLSNVKNCVKNVEDESNSKLKLTFKIGRGVFPLSLELITEIYSLFGNQEKVIIYLINELKSSKFKFHKLFQNISKHEASAIILALRKGIKVNEENYLKFFELKKTDKEIKEKLKKELNYISFLNNNIELLKTLVFGLLNCKITIYEAFDIINQKRLIKQFPK
ncbi:MAG: hypothetical protein ACQERB_01630 [Promethearchaeati archaeon]